MAKYSQGILGPVRGKVGTVVGSTAKGGIDYLKAYNANPANPNTALQQAQRGLFSQVVEEGKKLLNQIIRPYWNPNTSGTPLSGWALFIKENLLAASTDDIIPSELVLAPASGDIDFAPITSTSYSPSAPDLTVNWSDTPSGNQAEDSAQVIAYDSSTGEWFYNDGSDVRSDGSFDLTVGAGRTAANLHVFLFFHRGEGSAKETSPAAYSAVS